MPIKNNHLRLMGVSHSSLRFQGSCHPRALVWKRGRHASIHLKKEWRKPECCHFALTFFNTRRYQYEVTILWEHFCKDNVLKSNMHLACGVECFYDWNVYPAILTGKARVQGVCVRKILTVEGFRFIQTRIITSVYKQVQDIPLHSFTML